MGNLCSGQKVDNQAVEETSRQSTNVDFQGEQSAKGDRNEAIAERRREYFIQWLYPCWPFVS